MASPPCLTFVAGGPAPAAGTFSWWLPPPVERDGRERDDHEVTEHLVQTWNATFGRAVVGQRRELEVFYGDGLITVPSLTLPLVPVLARLAAHTAQPSLGARRGSSATTSVSVHPSVEVWSVLAKWALEIVADGRIVPALTRADSPRHAIASWRAVVIDDQRPEQFAQAMPIEAFATLRTSSTLWTASELVVAFADAVADACGRLGREPAVDPRRRAGHSDINDRIVAALTGTDPVVDDTPRRITTKIEAFNEWSAPVLGQPAIATNDVQLVVRVVPPASDDDSGQVAAEWRLHLALGARDSAATVDAADVWHHRGAMELGATLVEDPRDVLTRWLAAAGRLIPPIGRVLDDAAPAEVACTAAEAAALIDRPQVLQAAGIRVEVPAELGGARIERARLVLKIGRDAPEHARVGAMDDGALSMAALTDAMMVAQVGEEQLDAVAFAALVSAGPGIVRWRGRWVRVESELLDAQDQVGRSVALSLTEALAAALGGRHQIGGRTVVDTVAVGDVARAVERLRTAQQPSQITTDDLEGFRGSLRTYQIGGVAWMRALVELGFGAVLADEMGLGKTVEAIGLLVSRARGRVQLVVCPTSVVGNWVRELTRFAPDLTVVGHHGSERAVQASSLVDADVVVTTYALLRRDQSLLERIRWDLIVFDEAQQLKNPASQTARAARGLTCSARIAMTGTPLENRLADLWSIIDLTNPGLLGRRQAFDEQFAVPIERWRDDDAAQRLRRLVAPFMLRRRKDDEDVAVDLPTKTEIDVVCALTREQAGLYQAVIDETLAGRLTGSTFERRGRILALLTALKQICNHPVLYGGGGTALSGRSGKLERVTELLSEIVSNDGHALVFTQYRRMGDLLVRHLARALELSDVPFLHGGVSAGGRDLLVNRFQHDDDVPVMIVSLRAGGTGLNLTRANHVIHVDRWWNPAVEDQATDRAHRIGQRRPVTVHKLITAGTLEERIAAMLERKRQLADTVISSGESWVTELSDAEIRDLVALSSDALAVSFDDEDDEDAASKVMPAPQDDRLRPPLTLVPGEVGR